MPYNNKQSIYFTDSVKYPANQFWVDVKENSKTTSATHFQVFKLKINKPTESFQTNSYFRMFV